MLGGVGDDGGEAEAVSREDVEDEMLKELLDFRLGTSRLLIDEGVNISTLKMTNSFKYVCFNLTKLHIPCS